MIVHRWHGNIWYANLSDGIPPITIYEAIKGLPFQLLGFGKPRLVMAGFRAIAHKVTGRGCFTVWFSLNNVRTKCKVT